MGSRKKARVDITGVQDKVSAGSSNADDTEASTAPSTYKTQATRTEDEPTQVAVASDAGTSSTKINSDASSTRSSSGWYGSWKTKAPATTMVDDDSITTPKREQSEASVSKREVTPSPARYMANMTNASRRSSKSVPLAASTTKVHAMTGTASQPNIEALTKGSDAASEHLERSAEGADEGDASQAATSPEAQVKAEAQTSSYGIPSLRGWWSKPDNTPIKADPNKSADLLKAETDPDGGTAKRNTVPDPPGQTHSGKDVDALNPSRPSSGVQTVENKGGGTTPGYMNRLSWFYTWSRQQNADASEDTANVAEPHPYEAEHPQSDNRPASAPIPESTNQSSDTVANVKAEAKLPAPRSSGWIFWSREKTGTDSSSEAGSTRKQVGELAVADTPSQSKPEAAQFNEQKPASAKITLPQTINGRGTSKTKQNVDGSKPSTPTMSTKSATLDQEVVEKEGGRKASPKAGAKGKNNSQGSAEILTKTYDLAQAAHDRNIILPQFENTYRAAHHKTYWEQLRRMIWNSGPDQPRVFLEPQPQKVQRALAIGVHGFFPAAMLRTVLGQPTGTSIRFANLAAAAIKEWVKKQGDYDCEIDKAALEGEGFIADRVDILWKLLLNWMDKIRKADLILVAAHSQGVPVAIMLVAKLIQFGCVSPNARIGVCAMAGVNMGPFIEYKTSWLGGTANELFDFSRPESKVSLMYEEALEVVLRHGVRVTYIGSIDDQLVSLESSTFTPITHPYIYRAVFIDSRLQRKPDFIAALIGFVLKLRNLGIPDHGLIRELSPALAGSLVSGDGHSRLYDDMNVYLLAVRCTLETTALASGKNPAIERWSFSGLPGKKADGDAQPSAAGSAAMSASQTTASANPYFLPWAMRGVLEEELVRKELGDECAELLTLFEKWKPQSKGLKDVRFRLEAVRSKL